MASPAQIGEIIAGKYRVDGIVGQGGMGVVVAATDTILDRRVAVKFLLPQYAENRLAAGRFLREARATARLNSEHSVRIIEVGELPNGSPFIAMEYLQGVDLGTLVEQHGALERTVAIDYVLEAARGLAEAHAAGIVHRDVKPSNLFLAYQPSGKPVVKVLDFGVSKLNLGIEASAGSLTTTGQTLGSPLYMAPEQMRSSQHADARADIWSLGVVMFELLTGARPFAAESLAELVLVINQDPPLDPRVVRPDLPPALGAIMLRCLEKDPNRRFGSIVELMGALEPFGSRGSQRPRAPHGAEVGRQGTLVVAPDNPDAARLRALGDAVLGGGAPGSIHGSAAAAPASIPPGAAHPARATAVQAESSSSAPWASTNGGGPVPQRPVKKGSGTGFVIGASLVAGLLAVAAAVVVLKSRKDEPSSSDIASAASELERAASLDDTTSPRATESSAASGAVTESVPSATAGPALGASAAVTATLGAPDPAPPPSTEPRPEASGDPSKKVVRRPRTESPRSAKERLGF